MTACCARRRSVFRQIPKADTDFRAGRGACAATLAPLASPAGVGLPMPDRAGSGPDQAAQFIDQAQGVDRGQIIGVNFAQACLYL